ncbi:MAG: aminotransferase [Alphaproteobacteria bacterium]|nr:aminotransferase [Alphaproteobacteria bacterium]
MKPLSNSATIIRDYDNTHFMHPWEGMAEFGSADRTISASAEGIYVYDQHGRKLIDGPGGMWCAQIGYARKDMADAISDQVMKLSYNSPWNTASAPPALLAKKLADLAPGDLNTVFFTTGGSTAVDTAIRFMHFYNNRLGRRDKKIVLSRVRAYHGSTYLSASVTGRDQGTNNLDVERERVRLLPDVNPNLRPKGMSLDDWCDAKLAEMEALILETGPDKIGAFIAEPILASGGVIIPPPGYHKRTLELCHKYDILYISDEVVTAFGRLGHWFASKDVFDIQPDMITCAKGLTSGYLPLGACLISDKLIEQISGEGHENTFFNNGYTYSGHPVCCAAALKNIEIFENEKILEHVRALSPIFMKKLHALRDLPNVGDTRGMGLVGCVEAAVDSTGDQDRAERLQAFGSKVDKKCEELGLIVRPLGHMCVFSPPLIITEGQIDDMFAILAEAIRLVAKEF